ncbi:MAG: hypothetical protein QXP98_03755 [Thermoproteus sp.]
MSLEKNIVEKIASYIPGYAGYKEKEIRRETDALVRRRVSAVLAEAKSKMVLTPSAARAIAANRDAAYLWDSTKALFDRVIQRIDKAPAGYSGFYDLVKIDEAALDRIYQMDLALIEKAEGVAKLVDELMAASPGSDVWLQKLAALSSALSQLDSAVDERNNYMAGLASVGGGQAASQQAAEPQGRKGILGRLLGR